MHYALEVDFSAYDPSNYYKALSVQPRYGQTVRSFDELGTGQEQILALSFAYAYAKAFAGDDAGLVLVIEEPEAHLHPLAQAWLAQQMRRFVDAGVQLVITTHSPAFIDLCGLGGIALVRKDHDSEASAVRQISPYELASFCRDHNAPQADAASICEFYDWSATNDIKAGLFARVVVLVEGDTEQLALPRLLEKVGLQTHKCGIAIIPVGGRSSLARWWRLFRAYEIPVYAIFDNDSDDDSKGRGRDDLLTTMGLGDDDHAALRDVAGFEHRPGVAVFGPDFESVMRAEFDDYAQLESAAADAGVRGKPKVARWVAERLDVGHGGCLRILAAEVESLLVADRRVGGDAG
jgi:putative ATP-dependent endonuclease of OLD family